MQGLALFLAIYTQIQINRLGSEQWAEREQASAVLRVGLPATLPAITAAMANHQDAEVVVRCRQLEREWLTIHEELLLWRWTQCLKQARELRVDGWRYTPYVDMLPADWPGRIGIIGKYRDVARGGLWCADLPPRERWQCDRTAMMLYVTDLLVEGATVEEIRAMYARTVVVERKWLQQHPAILAECEVAEAIRKE